MVVSIELFGVFRNIAEIDKLSMPITGKTSAGDAAEYVRQKYPALPLERGSFLISVNHEPVSPEKLLRPNDVVCFIPHIGGG